VPRALQVKPPSSADRDCERLTVALVGAEGAPLDPGSMLAEKGFEVVLVDTVGDLPGVGPTPSLIALWVEGELSGAVSGDSAPMSNAMAWAPVVLVCAEIRPGDLRVAMSGGASGVVLESHLASTLGPTLQAAWAGQVCVPRQQAEQIEPAALSPREKQILGLVVMGYMNSQIAEQLFVAESTVKSHLYSAFNKLGVRSRTQATDLILDSERGLGMGIIALGGEPLEAMPDGDVMVTRGG
jgi:DNA-binding NarL/FixJ family response regulator